MGNEPTNITRPQHFAVGALLQQCQNSQAHGASIGPAYHIRNKKNRVVCLKNDG